MNLNDVYRTIAEATGLSANEVKKVLQAQAVLIRQTLIKEEEFPLTGVGKLKAKMKPERIGRNPQTGAKVTIKAGRRISFTTSKGLKEDINK